MEYTKEQVDAMLAEVYQVSRSVAFQDFNRILDDEWREAKKEAADAERDGGGEIQGATAARIAGRFMAITDIRERLSKERK